MNGARLDVQDGTNPGLNSLLCSSGTTTLRKVVEVAGPEMTNAPAVACLLGLKSIRQSRSILNRWADQLTGEERKMLQQRRGNPKGG